MLLREDARGTSGVGRTPLVAPLIDEQESVTRPASVSLLLTSGTLSVPTALATLRKCLRVATGSASSMLAIVAVVLTGGCWDGHRPVDTDQVAVLASAVRALVRSTSRLRPERSLVTSAGGAPQKF